MIKKTFNISLFAGLIGVLIYLNYLRSGFNVLPFGVLILVTLLFFIIYAGVFLFKKIVILLKNKKSRLIKFSLYFIFIFVFSIIGSMAPVLAGIAYTKIVKLNIDEIKFSLFVFDKLLIPSFFIVANSILFFSTSFFKNKM